MSGELILGALRQAHRALQEAGVPAAVMGGLALARWRRRRHTDDVDLLIAIDPPNPDDLVRTLFDAGFHPRRFPPVFQVGITGSSACRTPRPGGSKSSTWTSCSPTRRSSSPRWTGPAP